MSYPISTRIQGLLAKVESVYGSDALPVAGTDGVRVVGRIWESGNPDYAFPNERDDVFTGSLVGETPGQPAGRFMNMEFGIELRGAGAAYSSTTPVRPEVDPLLIACGFGRTHDDTGGSEKVTYDLADTGHGSATIYVYAAGKLLKVVGCRGTVTWDITAGALGRMRFNIRGVMTADPTEVALPAITYDTTESPPQVNMGLAIDPGTPWSPNFAEASLDLANDVVQLDDGNAADGLEGFAISGRQPRFNVQPRVVALTTYDPYTLRANRTVQTIDATLGSVQYNRVSIDVNEARLATFPAGENYQDLAAWRLEYALRDLALIFD